MKSKYPAGLVVLLGFQQNYSEQRQSALQLKLFKRSERMVDFLLKDFDNVILHLRDNLDSGS